MQIFQYTYPSTLGDVVSNFMVMGVYLQNPRSGCLLFPAPSGGRHPLEIKYTYPSTLGYVVSEYIWLWGSISKTLGMVACFFLHLQEGDALWKLNILIKVPWVMYMVLWVYLQNPLNGRLLFPALSGGRRPLEIKYTFPSTLGHLVSEYMWL